MKKSRLLHPINGALGLFLPFGTCSTATKACKDYCYQRKERYPSDEEKLNSLLMLLNKTPEQLAKEIYEELNEQVMHWFVAGDSWGTELEPKRIEYFFAAIIFYLDKMGVDQCGFTRHAGLWNLVPDILILSEDFSYPLGTSPEEITRISFKKFLANYMYMKWEDDVRKLIKEHNCRVAVPKQNTKDSELIIYRFLLDSERMKTVMIQNYDSCSHEMIKVEERDYKGRILKIKGNQNCAICLKKKTGCFKRSSYKMNSKLCNFSGMIGVADLNIDVQSAITDLICKEE